MLVSERVASGDGLRFREVGPTELKGIDRPVMLFEAFEATDRDG